MAAAIPVSPELKEPDVLDLDWVLLHRHGGVRFYDSPDAAAAAVRDDDTAVAVDTTGGQSGYFSFTLKPPPEVSFLKLHWPYGIPARSWGGLPTMPSVLAADGNHVVLRIDFPSAPADDLFVYTARPSPSPSSPPLAPALLLRLPPYPETGCFMLHDDTGILRRGGGEDEEYVLADLKVTFSRRSPDAELFTVRAFYSNLGEWRVHELRQPQGGPIPSPLFWTCSKVIPFAGRFLCWADYLNGMLLCDFGIAGDGDDDDDPPVLNYIPFPDKKHICDPCGRAGAPGGFRSLSVSQGVMRFVHITNYWDWEPGRGPCKTSDPTITIWTLDTKGSSLSLTWKMEPVIHLNGLWAQDGYKAQGLPHTPPEFPLVSNKNPDVLCCVLRESELYGKAWVIMLDVVKVAFLSCALCLNEQTICSVFNTDIEGVFCNSDLIPSDFCKCLNNSPDNDEKARNIQITPLFTG